MADDWETWSTSIPISRELADDWAQSKESTDTIMSLMRLATTELALDMAHGPKYGPPFRERPYYGPESPSAHAGGVDFQWSYDGSHITVCYEDYEMGDICEPMEPAAAIELARFLDPGGPADQ